MQLESYVNTLGQHLKARFGTRVRKLSLHVGFTCPNRDGALGRGGCTFCRACVTSLPTAAIGPSQRRSPPAHYCSRRSW